MSAITSTNKGSNRESKNKEQTNREQTKSSLNKEQILSHVPDDVQKKISDLFKKVDKNKEFEFIFFSKKGQQMNKEKYVSLLKYMRNKAKQEKLKIEGPERTLDISFSPEKGIQYRISISGSDTINEMITRIMEIQNKNYMIYKFLLYTMRQGKEKNKISFMLKTKEPNDTIDIDDLNMRVRLSTETEMTEQVINASSAPITGIDININKLLSGDVLKLEERKDMNTKIFYRLKERTSMYVSEDNEHFVRIDLTDTKNTADIRKINTTFSNYELEIEYGCKNAKSLKTEHLDKIYETSESLLKFVQQSKFIIGNAQSESVIQYYRDMMGISKTINSLVARQPVSLEIQHIAEVLPNKYAVTDKADGDRYFLIIKNSNVYLISQNLNVKDTGIVLDKNLEKYNGTILDGEYILLPKEKRHLYMAFDCIRNGNNDLRSIASLQQRLNNADKIIEDCFVFKGQQGFAFKSAPTQKDTFSVDEVSKFYGQELGRFHELLNKDISFVKEYPLIRRKFFMNVFGAKRWEIYKYASEYWKRYTEDSAVKFPYHLDGLVFTPMEQSYVTNAQESKYHELKWKPADKNSLDFYVEFKRDPQTGNILNVYDNSTAIETVNETGTDEGDAGEQKMVRNKTYRICNLYVGKNIGGKEQPVPFDQNYGVSEAYIYLKNGEARDIGGDILTDKIVVEFYYQYDLNIIPQQRWVPIKIRYDKTESVEKFQRRYGNYSDIADKVWRSIINPVLMDDFIELAKGNTEKRSFYDIKIKEMNAKISQELIATVNRENKYYQKVTKIATAMRHYHNFIKSNLIYTFCNKMYQSNTLQSVLDIACGRGGDIEKFYYTNVAYYVGVDVDAEGLKSQVNGAISRYNTFKKKKPNFPKMYFIQADARAVLEYDTQVKILSMDEPNKKLLERFFPTLIGDEKPSLYDIINCQFAMHYFLQDELSWSNFKKTLKRHLRNGGYFIATTFDAKQVLKAIGEKDSFTVHYDDSDGNKKIFFDIVKKYEDPVPGKPIGVGQGIDLYTSWMFEEGNYFTEYLVDLDFIKEELARDADLELVDSDLFANQRTIHKNFVTNAAKYESAVETQGYIAKVASYYEDNEMNEKCMHYSNLNRYFVFRKKSQEDTLSGTTNNQTGKTANKKQKGGDSENDNNYAEKYDFSDITKFRIPKMMNYDDNYSMINSIHKLLVSHSLFPKTLKVDEFMKDMGLPCVQDLEVSDKYLNDIAKQIIINHEIIDPENNKNKVENVMNGLNVFIVERDCNNFYDVSYALKTEKSKGSDKAIVLMKEGDLYNPIMRNEDGSAKGSVKGIFKMKDEMIQYLIEAGEKL